jgi:hypothetical protein
MSVRFIIRFFHVSSSTWGYPDKNRILLFATTPAVCLTFSPKTLLSHAFFATCSDMTDHHHSITMKLLVSFLPCLAFMVAGLLFVGAQAKESVSSDDSILSLSFWRFFLFKNHLRSCVGCYRSLLLPYSLAHSYLATLLPLFLY